MANNDSSSEIFRLNKQLCFFSFDGKFLAVANQEKLFIKNSQTFNDCLIFNFSHTIEGVQWSPKSNYILCYNIKECVVQIFSIYHPEWEFKLTEGSTGLESAIWAPDNKHILTLASFKIQLSIWCLESHSVTYIQYLKSSPSKGIEFSPNGVYLAIIVNEGGQDNVDIYKTKDWQLSRKLICKGLASIDGFLWSPNSEILSIWCAINGLAKMIIYSMINESYEALFHPVDNRCIATAEELLKQKFDENLRGLENVNWMPNGQFLAVSGHNETIVLLNCITWKPLLKLRLKPVVRECDYLIRVFKEIVKKDARELNSVKVVKNSGSGKHLIEEVSSRPINIPINRNETLGIETYSSAINVIDILEFSSCGRYLAVRNRSYMRSLWIWDIRTNGIDILVLQNVISGVRWDPIHPRLLVFTESNFMIVWNPTRTICVKIPREMTVLDARLNPNSNIAILVGYNRATTYCFEKDL